MTIELAPEIEKAIVAEAAATGRTPDDVANRYLAAMTESVKAEAHEIGVAELLSSIPSSEGAAERAKISIERMRTLRSEMNPAFGPASSQSFRDWMHQDHWAY